MPRDGGVGDACVGDTQCRAGLTCAEDDTCQPTGTTEEGAACMLSAECAQHLYCGASRACEAAGAGEDGADCEHTADCMAGLLCSVEGFAFRCRPAGMGDLGDACETERECLAGLRCLDAGGARTCESPPLPSGDGGTVQELPPALPRWPGETCTPDEGPPVAYFRVPRGDASDGDFYRLPFPNDARRTADGLDLSNHPTTGSALSTDVLGRVLEAAEEDLDGFATNPVVYFRFSRDYEWGDVTGERLRLIDVTPSSPEYGRDLGRSWLTTAGPISRYICPPWLALRRGHGAPLRPGTTYAVVLLRGVRTSEGEGHEEFARDADLDALLAESAPAGELAEVWARYAPLRAWLGADMTPDAADVLNATVFTTQDPRAMVPALRSAIRAGAAPVLSDVTLCADGATSPCDDGGERRCGAESDAYWEVHARVALPQFQAGTPPFEAPEDGGAIELDAAGVPQVARTEPVCMVMTIPKVAAAPASGFPLAIYAHGTGGAFTAPVELGLASTFATGEAITIGIDMPLHGARRGGSTRHPNNLVFNFQNPRAARDNLLQGAADLMSLVYFTESPVLLGAASPAGFDVAIDPSRVVLYGHSQGATHAQLMIAYEPGLRAVLLSGAGGDLTESLLTKTEPVNIARALPLALLDVDGDGSLAVGDSHPALAMIQMFFERADPVNFGRHVRVEPLGPALAHLFMTYGLGDSYSTERTMAAYARSAALPHVEPMLADVGLGAVIAPPVMGNVDEGGAHSTIGLRQYPAVPDSDGHFVSTESPEASADVARFLLGALAGETPSIGE